jgi:hypothetical protein
VRFRSPYAWPVEITQTYVERLPLPALAGRVRTVWVQRTASHPYLQRIEVLPAHTTLVGVRFWPVAASSLLGLPADELLDLTVRLHDLWPGEALRLADLLAAAATAPTRPTRGSIVRG